MGQHGIGGGVDPLCCTAEREVTGTAQIIQVHDVVFEGGATCVAGIARGEHCLESTTPTSSGGRSPDVLGLSRWECCATESAMHQPPVLPEDDPHELVNREWQLPRPGDSRQDLQDRHRNDCGDGGQDLSSQLEQYNGTWYRAKKDPPLDRMGCSPLCLRVRAGMRPSGNEEMGVICDGILNWARRYNCSPVRLATGASGELVLHMCGSIVVGQFADQAQTRLLWSDGEVWHRVASGASAN